MVMKAASSFAAPAASEEGRPAGDGPQVAHVPDPRRVDGVLGFTPAESCIAVRLARAMTIDDIAAETGRSRTTATWHMGQICDSRHRYSRSSPRRDPGPNKTPDFLNFGDA